MIKQVTCRNRKNYSLTVGRQYTSDSTDMAEGYTSIVNDAGRRARYATDLFEDVVIATPTPDTVQQILETVRVSATSDNIVLNFTIDGDNRRILNARLTEEGSNISCGVRQMSGLNGFTSRLVNSLSEFEDRGDLVQQLINKAYAMMVNSSESCSIVILSTNDDENSQFSITDIALNLISVSSHRAMNPNSGNNIKLWIVDVSENFEEPDDEDVD